MTLYTDPKRPPSASAPKPSAPGKARRAAAPCTAAATATKGVDLILLVCQICTCICMGIISEIMGRLIFGLTPGMNLGCINLGPSRVEVDVPFPKHQRFIHQSSGSHSPDTRRGGTMGAGLSIHFVARLLDSGWFANPSCFVSPLRSLEVTFIHTQCLSSSLRSCSKSHPSGCPRPRTVRY